jgi:hypothetical protein
MKMIHRHWQEPHIGIDKIKPFDWSFPCEKSTENENIKPPNYRDRSFPVPHYKGTIFKNIKNT